MAGKRKRTGVERRMISVPPDLDARMKKVDGENWSAVACRAFERRLGELARKVKETQMDEVARRLRASMQSTRNEARKIGYTDGKEWAIKRADAEQLGRLEEFSSKERNWNSFFQDEDVYSPSERLLFEILGDEDCDRDQALIFWEGVSSCEKHEIDTAGYLRSFIDGAMEVWSAVKDDL